MTKHTYVFHAVPLVISLWTINLKKTVSAFASWRIYANLYLRVYLCLCKHTYIQEYVYGRQCLYNNILTYVLQ